MILLGSGWPDRFGDRSFRVATRGLEAATDDGGLRYEDEFVRHKLLDAIGDIYLLGHTMIGSFTSYKSGHALNNQLLLTLLADETAWEVISYQDPAKQPVVFGSVLPSEA